MKPDEIRYHLDQIFISKQALLHADVIRSERFTGELGEYIAELQLGGTRAPTTSNPGWDLEADIGRAMKQKVQVKCHAKGAANNARWTQFTGITLFDWLFIIVLTPDFRIKEMFLIDQKSLAEIAKEDKPNGWTVKWDDIKNPKFEIPRDGYKPKVVAAFCGCINQALMVRGMTPTSMGPGIPHGGMGGTFMRWKKSGGKPVFAAPPLPCLGNSTPAQAAGLLNSWFKQIQDILRELKRLQGTVDVAFMGGGTVPIPDWFRDWCAQEGITILIIEPPSNPEDTEMTASSSPLAFATTPPSQAHADLRLIHSLAEGVEIRCGEDLIHLVATAENSGWVLTAESFLSKYWRSIWKDKNMPITGILHELSGAKETLNREMLYRLLLTIQQDSKHDSRGRDRSQLEALSVHVAREIATANDCEPPDFSDFPPFMAAALPQPSEYIACSVAMECLCVMTGDDRESPWKMQSSPKLTSQSLEGIIKALRNQHCRPATPGSVDYCERVIRRIMFWQE